MRERLVAFAVAASAVLILASCLFVQTAAPQDAATATAPDLSGIWRRSRRPPDNARKYTLHELAGTLTNQEPPMTAWGEAKYKAAKPNVGPRGVPISQTNDPDLQMFSTGSAANLSDACRATAGDYPDSRTCDHVF